MSKLLVIFSEYLISKKIFIVDEEKLEVYKENLLPKQSLSATERAAIPSAAAQTAAEATAEAKAEAKAVRAHSATERAAIPSAAHTAAAQTAAEAAAQTASKQAVIPSAAEARSSNTALKPVLARSIPHLSRNNDVPIANLVGIGSYPDNQEFNANEMTRGNPRQPRVTRTVNVSRDKKDVAPPERVALLEGSEPVGPLPKAKLTVKYGGAPTKSQLTGDDIMEVFMKMLQILDENKNNS